MDTKAKLIIVGGGTVAVVALVLLSKAMTPAPKTTFESFNSLAMNYRAQQAETAARVSINRDNNSAQTTISAIQAYQSIESSMIQANAQQGQTLAGIITQRQQNQSSERIAALQASSAVKVAQQQAKAAKASNSNLLPNIGNFIQGGGISKIADGVGKIISLF